VTLRPTERGRTLGWLYGLLRADVERLGTLIETDTGPKSNPSVVLLLRVLVELDRREANTARPAEESDDIGVALLRAVPEED